MEEKSLPWRDIKTRGLTVIQFIRYVHETLGDGEVNAVLKLVSTENAASIRNARKSSWYPFECQRQLREAIISRIDPTDPFSVMYRMGLVTASWDFSGFLKPLFSFISRKSILNHSAKLWGKYYDHGKMEVSEYDDQKGYARIELSDFPADPHFYPVVTSWMKVALEILKSPNSRVEYSQYLRDNPVTRFDLYWDVKLDI